MNLDKELDILGEKVSRNAGFISEVIDTLN